MRNVKYPSAQTLMYLQQYFIGGHVPRIGNFWPPGNQWKFFHCRLLRGVKDLDRINILLLSLGCENNILLPSIFVGHWNKIKFLFMRCNSAISHLNNLANFFSKIRQSATSATIFRFQVSKAVLKGVW